MSKCQIVGNLMPRLISSVTVAVQLHVQSVKKTITLLEFLSLKGGYRGSSESTHVKMSNCWKSHAAAHIFCHCRCTATCTECQKNDNTLKTLYNVFVFKDSTSTIYNGIIKLHLYICLRLISLFIT